jgi:hypothetical protein
VAKNAQVVAHVERSVREALEQLARENDRSLSQYVERILQKHLEKRKRVPVKTRAAKPRAG